jgi:hypothetical protein
MMVGLDKFSFAIASLALLLEGAPRRLPTPSNLFEPVVRAVASKHCGVCYLAVDGKPPSHAVVQLLAGVPRVRPLPPSGVPADERGRANVIDLFKPRFTSRDRGEISAGVSVDMGSGLIAFESCTYHLGRTTDGWQLRPEETRCVVM